MKIFIANLILEYLNYLVSQNDKIKVFEAVRKFVIRRRIETEAGIIRYIGIIIQYLYNSLLSKIYLCCNI